MGTRGAALIFVLWILMLLVVLLLGFTGTTRTELLIVRNQAAAARAAALADAGVSFAILGVLDQAPATRWTADGREHLQRFGGGTILIAAQDEGGKVDLNGAPPLILDGLFRVLGVDLGTANEIVAGILARRAAAAGGEGEPGGRSGPLPRAFHIIGGLRQIPGVSAALYARVAPFITVHGDNSQINAYTAPATVLDSLPGAEPEAVAAFIAARDAAGASFASLPPLLGVENIEFAATRIFTVTARGMTPAGAVFIRQALVAATGGPRAPVAILSWRRAREEPGRN